MPSQLLTARSASREDFTDCRAYERRECNLPSSCQPASAFGSEGAKWPAVICNIAPGGISLVLGRRFERGTGLAVELPATVGRSAYTVLAKVIHVQRHLTGSWLLGCQLISELGDDEIDRFFPEDQENLQYPGAADPSPRQERTHFAVHCRFEIGPNLALECLIKRMRASGAWPLPVGKVVMLNGGIGSEKWNIQVEVVECVQHGEQYVLQGRLIHPPTMAKLLNFLHGA